MKNKNNFLILGSVLAIGFVIFAFLIIRKNTR